MVLTTSESQRFYQLFLLCMFLIPIPVKNLAYLVPPLYLLIQLVSGNAAAIRAVILVITVATVSTLSMSIDSFRGQQINLPGFFLAMLTYLPIFLLLCERFDQPIDDALFGRLINTTAWFVIVQSAIGVLQFVVSHNGDAVAGSFGLLDFHFNTISIAQVYFTFTLFGMILFLMLDFRRVIVQVAIIVGLIVCTLAQSGHQTIFFAVSFGLFSVIQKKRSSAVLYGVILISLSFFLVNELYPSTFAYTGAWFRKVVEEPESPKRALAADGVRIVNDLKNAILGTGIGQYSSRAALITSNDYLSRDLPNILVGKSKYFSDSIEPANEIYEDSGQGSAIWKPYFSILSVIVEFGIVQSLFIFGVLLAHVRKNLTYMASPVPQIALTGMVSNVGLLFFILCCAIENYAEFPQAIFLPFLLYVAAQSRAKRLAVEARSEETG